MVQHQNTVWCDGCGVEILWPPVASGDRVFCCADCQGGLGCECGEELEEDLYRQEGTSPDTLSLTYS